MTSIASRSCVGHKGPCTAKNATGGAVSFFTRNPSLDSYDGYLTLGAGNYSEYTVSGRRGRPDCRPRTRLACGCVLRKARWLAGQRPTGCSCGERIDVLAGRLSFLAKPNDSLSVLLKAAVSRSGGNALWSTADQRGAERHRDQSEHQLVSERRGLRREQDDRQRQCLAEDGLADQRALHADLSDRAMTTGGWVEIGDDAASARLIYGLDTYASTVHSYSQELRIASHDTGGLSWLGGVYYGGDSTHAWLQYHYFDAYPGSFVTNTNPR